MPGCGHREPAGPCDRDDGLRRGQPGQHRSRGCVGEPSRRVEAGREGLRRGHEAPRHDGRGLGLEDELPEGPRAPDAPGECVDDADGDDVGDRRHRGSAEPEGDRGEGAEVPGARGKHRGNRTQGERRLTDEEDVRLDPRIGDREASGRGNRNERPGNRDAHQDCCGREVGQLPASIQANRDHLQGGQATPEHDRRGRADLEGEQVRGRRRGDDQRSPPQQGLRRDRCRGKERGDHHRGVDGPLVDEGGRRQLQGRERPAAAGARGGARRRAPPRRRPGRRATGPAVAQKPWLPARRCRADRGAPPGSRCPVSSARPRASQAATSGSSAISYGSA